MPVDPQPEDHIMPVDPQRVQAVFLAAVEYHEPADRAAVLERECSGDAERRRRVEVFLGAHDQFDSSLDEPPGRTPPGHDALDGTRSARSPEDSGRHVRRRHGGIAHLRFFVRLHRGYWLVARWAAAPLNDPVLAMAHHRLGHRDDAWHWLERAHGRRGGAVSRRGVEFLASSGAWRDRLECQLLLREADAMILDAAFPADPFAP